jgi:hypothetical protein
MLWRYAKRIHQNLEIMQVMFDAGFMSELGSDFDML